MVTGEKEMIAVVDREVERLVLVGTTAATRRASRLVQHNPMTFIDQAHGRAQSSDAGPDDMDRCCAFSQRANT